MNVVARHLSALALANTTVNAKKPTVEASHFDRAMIHRVQADRNRLRSIASMNTRAIQKSLLLDDYRNEINKAMIAGESPAWLVQVMVWAFDAIPVANSCALDAVMIADYCLRHNIFTMPEGFEREFHAYLAESLAKAYLEHGGLGLGEFVCHLVSDFANIDMHDEVKAKLFHAAGEAKAANNDFQQAIDYLEKAIAFNKRTRVKKRIQELKSRLLPPPESDKCAGGEINAPSRAKGIL